MPRGSKTRALPFEPRSGGGWFIGCALTLQLIACGPSVEVRRDLSYDERYGEATSLDLFLPADRRAPAPWIVMVHGGGWKGDTKSDLGDLPARFAEAGFATASLNYRLVPDGQFPNASKDVACAVSWLLAHSAEFGARDERYGLFGYSAGAHLVSLLSVHPEDPETAPDCGLSRPPPPAAVISGAGPQDLRLLSWAPEVQNFLGGTEEDVGHRYAAASPIEHVDRDEPPFLFVHGDQDWHVPMIHSIRMHNALRSRGNHSELLILHGGGHTLNPGPSAGYLSWEAFSTDAPEARSAMSDFFERELRP